MIKAKVHGWIDGFGRTNRGLGRSSWFERPGRPG